MVRIDKLGIVDYLIKASQKSDSRYKPMTHKRVYMVKLTLVKYKKMRRFGKSPQYSLENARIAAPRR